MPVYGLCFLVLILSELQMCSSVLFASYYFFLVSCECTVLWFVLKLQMCCSVAFASYGFFLVSCICTVLWFVNCKCSAVLWFVFHTTFLK